MLNIGDNVPNTTLESTRGSFNPSERNGRWLVLYFYPKDNTSGCTLEARDFTAQAGEFEALGCDIAGISRDTVRTHQGFCQRQELTIELVSDKDEELCNAFGVIRDKIMYGKKCRGIVRSTYLVNPEGKIVHVWSPVKVNGHVEEVLAELRSRL